MRVLLLVNSSASSVTARSRVVIQKALSADHEVTLAETSRRGHAARLAQGAAATGTELVVVLGGDGTLNEAANGLAGSHCALAPLPGGSTNVFARTIGLPNDPIEATGALLDALARGSIRRVGLGSVNGRYFLFHVGMGFDAAVVAQVERRSGLKRYAGHPLFIWAGFATWMRHYDRSRPRFSVRFADGSVVDDAYFCICLNTNPYTFLGNRPLDLAREATLDRGLAAVTLRTLAFAPTMRVIGSALAPGRHLRSSRWTDHRVDLDEVTVEGYGPFPYQVDGDHLGDVERLVLRHEPDVLDLVHASLIQLDRARQRSEGGGGVVGDRCVDADPARARASGPGRRPVQVATSRPRSCARSTRASSTVETCGWIARCPWSAASSTAARASATSSVSQPVASVGVEGAHAVDGRSVEGRDDDGSPLLLRAVRRARRRHVRRGARPRRSRGRSASS